MAASQKGIETKGYKPTEQDHRELAKKLNTVESGSENQPGKSTESPREKQPEAATPPSPTPDPEYRTNIKETYEQQPSSEALKQHPELIGMYKLDRAAETFAEAHIAHPESRKAFKDSIRDKAFDELAKGNKLPDVKEHQRPIEQERVKEAEVER